MRARRLLSLFAAAIAALALAACETADTIGDEVDAQKNKVKTVIEDPTGAADDALNEQLEQQGVDGEAPPLPGQDP